MGNKKVPYLCGGTLFFLLVQAKKPRAKAREREQGKADGLKDPAMMEGLIQAITGNNTYAYADSLKKNTSQFRECRIDGSTYIPFNDPATASGYDYAVTNNYNTVLCRMSKFTEDFINPSKAAWLVRVLLDVIDQDAGKIGDDAHFCVQSDGSFLSKSDMMSADRFELQPFLVGIVHYILMNRSDNISGQDTLDDWGTKASERSERKLKKDFQLGKTRTTIVDWYKPAENDNTDDFSDTAVEPDTDADYIEAEVVDDESGAADNLKKQEGQSVTIIQQQTNVVQYGEKSVSLVNNGTINIDL